MMAWIHPVACNKNPVVNFAEFEGDIDRYSTDNDGKCKVRQYVVENNRQFVEHAFKI